MKKLFFTVALMATSLVASAQFATSNGGGSFSAAKTSAEVSGHSSFFVEYNSINPDEMLEDCEDETATGLSIGFNKAFSIADNVGGLPLFVEAGAKLTYAWATMTDEDLSEECDYDCGDEFTMGMKMTSRHAFVTVPINVMYKFAVPSTSVVLEPFVGLTFKGHILGGSKATMKFEACCDDTEADYEEMEKDIDEMMEEMSMNYFDKDDMGGKKYTANRFALGYQIGVNVSFGKYYAGVSYGSDFSDYMSEKLEVDSKLQTTSVTVGVRF